MPKQSGQSLIEVLVALSIAAVVVIALVVLVLSGLKNAQFAQSQVKSTKYAQEAIDQVKTIRDRNGTITINNYACNPDPCTFSNLWGIQLTNGPTSCITPAGCYFNLTGSGAALSEVNPAANQGYVDLGGGLSRQIFVSDTNTYQIEKTITVKVKWSDVAGEHTSNLQTILTKH